MSLYDDIISKNQTESNDWSTSKTSSIKLLQDHLQLKRTTQNLAKQSNNNSYRKLIPTSVRPSKHISDYTPVQVVSGSFTSSKSTSPLGGDWDVSEEYDPRWPNDYERINKEKSEAREREQDAQRAKKVASRSFQVTATRSLGLDYDDDEDEGEEKQNKSKSRANASIAPPPTLLVNVEKVNSIAKNVGYAINPIAVKMMVKLGYKEGQGLGKEEQGMSKPLQVEKTGKALGKIVYESDSKQEDCETFELPPSRVVLLRNMVGPGEVDEDLKPEIKEECSKYGDVCQCMIFEKSAYETEEDAVFIFVEFRNVESANKAFMDLNGRYFGGRIVKASFYDVDRFAKGDFRD